MIESWRWFGPSDPVTLADARQTGATGIVTALHDKYDGRAWTVDDIEARQTIIRAQGLTWEVCESIPMHGAIKLRAGPFRRYIDQWKDSLVALARSNVQVICYNFMPVVDWTRTDLRLPTAQGGEALHFDIAAFAAYDVFILRRAGADADYAPDVLARAERLAATMSDAEADILEQTIIAGLPGGEDSHTREGIRARLAEFNGVTAQDLRANLLEFLREVVPVAEEEGARLALHPDDPPFSLFGLPRIASTRDDLAAILSGVDSLANGLTLCVGSLSSRIDNNVEEIAKAFADRIHFVHLRDVTCEADGSFTEANHLDGRTNMVAVITTLLEEERRREEMGRADTQIPMRPDHGHVLLDDIGKSVNPGYSCIGRLKGLAELRGVTRAAEHFLSQKHSMDESQVAA